MSAEENDKLDKILDKLDDLHRGVYGDDVNEVPGLLTVSKHHEKRIKSLEDTRKKALWVGGGILAFLEASWHGLREFFTGN